MIICCKNIWEFIKIDFGLTFKSSLILTMLYFMCIPAIRGISNLDSMQSAQCLSQSVAFTGVLIIVPAARHELDRNVKEILCAKAWPYVKSISIRLIGGFLLVFCFAAGFALMMQVKNCVFPFWSYVLASLLYAGFMGTMGLMVSLTGRNAVAGYLSALGYWTLCQLQVIQETDLLYLFPVENGELQIWKLIILLSALAVFTGSILALASSSPE